MNFRIGMSGIIWLERQPLRGYRIGAQESPITERDAEMDPHVIKTETTISSNLTNVQASRLHYRVVYHPSYTSNRPEQRGKKSS